MGMEILEKYWFVCKVVWEANIVENENRQITIFIRGLQDRTLNRYKNFIENGAITKQEINKYFLEIFRMQDNKHLFAHHLKAIVQRIGEIDHEYEKRFKYLLNQIPTKME